MRNFIEFLAKHHHQFVFILLEAIGFTLLFRYNNYQNSVRFSSANVVTGKIYEWSSQPEKFLSLATVNQHLTQRNLALEQKVVELSERLTAVTKDSPYVKTDVTQQLSQLKQIPAKVVSNSLKDANNLITIDKGSVDGMRKDMGVVSGTGVVGIVYLVPSHYAIVIPLFNTKSNVSCKIENRDYFGFFNWQGGSTGQAFLDDIPRHAHFKLHENIVTSGYSSVFLPSILVGKILHVYNSPDGVSYWLRVQLATDFTTLRDVSVIDNTLMKERIEVMRAARDLMEMKDN